MAKSMHSKSVVITGASTGIGKACALHLDKLGYQVFAGVRTEADALSLQQASSASLTTIYIDIAKSDSILSATNMIKSTLKSVGLYGLINNAGIVVAGPLEFIPIDALRAQLEINVIGHIAVTQALLPLLRESKGRIINMSSVSGRVATPFLGPYAASKFALEALSDSMRLELMPWDINVSVIEPGPISTPIWSKSIEATKLMIDKLPQKAKVLYGSAFEAALQRENNIEQSMSTPDVVVRAVVHALMSRRPHRRYRIGVSGFVADIFARFLPDILKDWIIKRQRKL
tara:strand:- start:1757 stop:2617 length:861 start_codon:yes stop_codon:yes gene_type:complete